MMTLSSSSERIDSFPWRVSIILVLPSKGRNLGGIDSHVLRPIMTAFVSPGEGGVDVTFLKCFMSGARRHGKFPFDPIPREEAAAATTAAMSVMKAAGILSLAIWS